MAGKIDWENRIGRRLKLRDLHVYFTVVQCGSMAKAAVELGVAQPTISEIIADLEHTFGVRLLDRGARGVEPTIYGTALLKRGIAAFDELKQSTRDIEFLADPTAGELNIGCAESIAAAVLPPIVERFERQYPRVIVNVDDVPSPAVGLLRDRKHDLIFARIVRPRSDEDFDVETLFDDHLVVVAGSRSKWARRRTIALADLLDAAWLLAPPDTWGYDRVAEAFNALGLDMPKAPLFTLSVHLRVHLVESGRFISAFPRSIANQYKLKELPLEMPVRPWPVVMVTLKNRTLSPIVERFLECARAVTKSTAAWRPTANSRQRRRAQAAR
jgi:DNA-binding transcriptional LysR family regulator